MNHLIIPDAHVKPGQSLLRFEYLGRLILDQKPEKIICLGDFADMESLCSYDKGKKDYSRRNYIEDIEAARVAQDVLFYPIREYNKHRKENKKKQYKPKLYMLMGNHENRINRAIDLDHVLLDGLISEEDLGYEENGWEVIPFLQPLYLDGIAYSHYFVSGIMGRPISGEHPAASLLAKQHMSCTVGHSHVLDYAVRTVANSRKIHGLSAGCFLSHRESYAGPANDLWWKGVLMKHDVSKGQYDLEMISLKRLEEEYGELS